MKNFRASLTAVAVVAAMTCTSFAVDTADAQVQQQVDYTVQADGSVIVTLADGGVVTLDADTASRISQALAAGNAESVGSEIEAIVRDLGGSTAFATAVAAYAADAAPDVSSAIAIGNGASRAATDPTASGAILQNVSNSTGIQISVLNQGLQDDPGQRQESRQAANQQTQDTTQQAALTNQPTEAGPPDDLPNLPDAALNSPVIDNTENPATDVSPGQN